jgi:hypothetical protein
MYRILAVVALLLAAISVFAQDEPKPRFEIDSVQISPDGRLAVFRIAPSANYWQAIWATPPGELYLIDLERGRVFPLALQPQGLVHCLLLPEEEYRTCQQIFYGVPAFLPDGSQIVWTEVYDDVADTEWFFDTRLGYRMVEAAPEFKMYLSDAVLLGWIDVALLVPALRQATNQQVFSISRWPDEDGNFADYLRLYDFAQSQHTTLQLSVSDGKSIDTRPGSFWVWLANPEHGSFTSPSRNGRWHVFDLNLKQVVETTFGPVAELEGESMRLIYAPTSGGSLWWQVALADPSLSPEEAIARARQLTNADGAESVRAALESALTAEFGQTGFSLHPGMTAIFDEFQIYDMLGVEREDTLLVPLEWRLAQPPEGESRPLEIDGPHPFPGGG